MKAVMISIKPQWCDLIASGKKTIEVRKTKPKLETPFKCYLYETKGRCDVPRFMDEDGHVNYHGSGMVIGEFVCDKIFTVDCDSVAPFARETEEYIDKETCMTREQMWKYSGCLCDYGWHISELRIYDKPKTLDDFRARCKYENRDCCACPYFDYEKMDCKIRKLNRPPQSWCYVEG